MPRLLCKDRKTFAETCYHFSFFFHTVSCLFVFINAYMPKCIESSPDSLVRVAPKYKLRTRLHPGFKQRTRAEYAQNMICLYTSGQGQAIKAVFENTPRLDWQLIFIEYLNIGPKKEQKGIWLLTRDKRNLVNISKLNFKLFSKTLTFRWWTSRINVIKEKSACQKMCYREVIVT